MLMFNTIRGLSPAYLQNLFSIRSTPYNFRDSEIKLDLPKPRTTTASVALAIAGRYLGKAYPFIYGNQTLLDASKGKLTNFITNVSQALTGQSCKTVYL